MHNGVVLLLLVIVISGIATVYVRHQHRLVFIVLQEVQHQRDQLNIEWRQLLLEESTWSRHQLVERGAREKLGMTIPSADSVVTLSNHAQ